METIKFSSVNVLGYVEFSYILSGISFRLMNEYIKGYKNIKNIVFEHFGSGLAFSENLPYNLLICGERCKSLECITFKRFSIYSEKDFESNFKCLGELDERWIKVRFEDFYIKGRFYRGSYTSKMYFDILKKEKENFEKSPPQLRKNHVL